MSGGADRQSALIVIQPGALNMIVKIDEKGLFLEPETDFGTQVISSYRGCTAFVKCGVTPAEVLGLAVRPAQGH